MFEANINIRVRYAETDQMGYVYYGNYATYYEVARVEALRQLDFSYKEMENQGVMLPVSDLKTKFYAPATFDDKLKIKTTIPTFPKVRIIFNYEIYNESEKLLNEGSTTLVFVDINKRKPCKAPQSFLSKMEKFF